MSISPKPLRLAMLGMIEGNGHPYSWSAIFNDFDDEAMARCPYAGIPKYLTASRDKIGIPGARVTHVWTDRPEEAPLVARASRIDHVLARPEDAIGQVDAVLIATDDGTDHVRRARPFVEAGLSVFIDKPLATTEEELRTFVAWHREGARLLSTSAARYDPGLDALREALPSLGELRWIGAVTIKSWERYGIHRLEPVFAILGPGFESISLGPRTGRTETAHLIHRSGAQVSIVVAEDAASSFRHLRTVGSQAFHDAVLGNTFTAFKRQLEKFVDYVRTDEPSVPFADTVEMMAVLIAGLESRAAGGARRAVAPVLERFRSGA